MPRKVNKRSIDMVASWARRKKKNAQRKEHPASAFISDELVDMHDKTTRALSLIEDGLAMINEGHDIINSIPKRK